MTEGSDPGTRQAEAEGDLTGIPARIHLAAAHEGDIPATEQGQAVIDAFLDTLARIALAVAGRSTPRGREYEDEAGRLGRSLRPCLFSGPCRRPLPGRTDPSLL